MKKLVKTLILFGLAHTSFAQGVCEPPIYNFNSKDNVSGNGGLNSEYRFNNVLSNVNATVIITKLQNASINNTNMDNASPYTQAWQPFITFTNNRNAAADSSYIEFRVQFKSNGVGNPLINQSCMAMTIIDCDGNGTGNNYREFVKVSLPGTPYGIANSTVTTYTDARWMLFKSGPATFNNIDSNDKAAMAMMSFPETINTITLRIGVVGPVSGGTTRQFSLYFKSFTSLLVPLPVKITNFNLIPTGNSVQLNWNGMEEQNFSHYEVYKSNSGADFNYVSTVYASGESSFVKNYTFIDPSIDANTGYIYYKLKLVDKDGHENWSTVRALEPSHLSNLSGLSNVYPNPANNVLNIVPGYDDAIIDVQITDIFGKSVYSEHLALSTIESSIDISQYTAGIYTIRIKHEDGSTSNFKFVKQ